MFLQSSSLFLRRRRKERIKFVTVVRREKFCGNMAHMLVGQGKAGAQGMWRKRGRRGAAVEKGQFSTFYPVDSTGRCGFLRPARGCSARLRASGVTLRRLRDAALLIPPRKMPLAFGQPVFSSASFAVRLLRTPSRFWVSRCACSRRAAGPAPFGLLPFPPDRGNRPSDSGHKHPGLRPFLVCIPRFGPSALLTTAPRFWVTRTGC